MARHANPFTAKTPKIVWTKEFLAAYNKRNGTNLSYGNPDPLRPGKKIRHPRAILTPAQKAERDAAVIRERISNATRAAVLETLSQSPSFGHLATKVAQAEFVIARCDGLLNEQKFSAIMERLQKRINALQDARTRAAEIRKNLVEGMGGLAKVREEIVKDATLDIMAGNPYIPASDFVENLLREYVTPENREFLSNLTDPFATLDSDDSPDESEEDSDNNE